MERKEGETTTLFAQNIPPIYHWRGLRQLFGRHGDVVSSFIVRKYDRVGKRFGFVSFSNKNDADRAALRLNGLWILRYRLTVKEARYRDKSQSRKLYTPSDSKVVSSAKQEKNSISRASMEEQTMRSSKIVQGEVDENVVRKL
ncbi:RNA binding protein fox-1 homolog 2-like [Hibiscus syriacus]|uniref:RNA binding protein fox-1 homolog 2-like n=1 Tax=Hibiscus syriacus TaxID=106335 RepID=UPI001922FA6C|nr:RNA binding protein fox-1 homolog 2-like [Hibiscus syriacus]